MLNGAISPNIGAEITIFFVYSEKSVISLKKKQILFISEEYLLFL